MIVDVQSMSEWSLPGVAIMKAAQGDVCAGPLVSSESHAHTRNPQSEEILALHFAAGYNERLGCRVECVSSTSSVLFSYRCQSKCASEEACSKAVFVNISQLNPGKR